MSQNRTRLVGVAGAVAVGVALAAGAGWSGTSRAGGEGKGPPGGPEAFALTAGRHYQFYMPDGRPYLGDRKLGLVRAVHPNGWVEVLTQEGQVSWPNLTHVMQVYLVEDVAEWRRLAFPAGGKGGGPAPPAVTSKDLSGTWAGEKDGVKVKVTFEAGDGVRWSVTTERGSNHAGLKREDDWAAGAVRLRFYSAAKPRTGTVFGSVGRGGRRGAATHHPAGRGRELRAAIQGRRGHPPPAGEGQGVAPGRCRPRRQFGRLRGLPRSPRAGRDPRLTRSRHRNRMFWTPPPDAAGRASAVASGASSFALSDLLGRLGDIRLTGGPWQPQPALPIPGPARLPVRFDPPEATAGWPGEPADEAGGT